MKSAEDIFEPLHFQDTLFTPSHPLHAEGKQKEHQQDFLTHGETCKVHFGLLHCSHLKISYWQFPQSSSAPVINTLCVDDFTICARTTYSGSKFCHELFIQSNLFLRPPLMPQKNGFYQVVLIFF